MAVYYPLICYSYCVVEIDWNMTISLFSYLQACFDCCLVMDFCGNVYL